MSTVEAILCPRCRKPALQRKLFGIPVVICPCVGVGNVEVIRGKP